ncbi:MAG: glucose 1-dehydrogenase [Balneolaceae bacterium]|nr:glucose 1-dehydrogenase [Balneolaceae bacterium]
MDYRGKTVIVTGGANGIGRAIAIAFAGQGDCVVIADVDELGGKKLAMQIQKKGESAMFIRTDVSDPESIKAMVRKVVDELGEIHILINNAGISEFKPFFELSVEEWGNVINTNLRSAFLCSQESAGIIKNSGGGAIVNIASTRALMSEPKSEAYAASKGGLLALTHAMAASLSEHKITVNAISPGWIHTRDYEKLREKDHKQHFAQRVGKPDDIARACLFLCGPQNNFITGENFVIDGGMTRKMIYES